MTTSMRIHKKLQELCKSFHPASPEQHCAVSVKTLMEELKVSKEAILGHLEVLSILGYVKIISDDEIIITPSGLGVHLSS